MTLIVAYKTIGPTAWYLTDVMTSKGQNVLINDIFIITFPDASSHLQNFQGRGKKYRKKNSNNTPTNYTKQAAL